MSARRFRILYLLAEVGFAAFACGFPFIYMDSTPSQECLSPGTVLPSKGIVYVIEKVLGQGSFGITYLASARLEGNLGSFATGSKVALKEFFMRSHNNRQSGTTTVSAPGDQTMFLSYRDKFEKEALSLSRLHHKGIVKVCDLFEYNNTAYYAMELLDESLEQFLANMRGGCLPEWTAVEIAITIGESIKYLHSQNMVHLDLKPGNIMFRGDDPVLIDFGLSKQYDAAGKAETSSNVGGGTPGYAPLEQAAFSTAGILPVTMDVYALGATLYRMLSGETPPPAYNICEYGFDDTALRQKGVSPELISIIRQAMMPLSRQRYQTMDKMVAALRSLDVVEVEVVGSSSGETIAAADVAQPEVENTRRTQRKPRRGPADDQRATRRPPVNGSADETVLNNLRVDMPATDVDDYEGEEIKPDRTLSDKAALWIFFGTIAIIGLVIAILANFTDIF